VRQPKAGLVYR